MDEHEMRALFERLTAEERRAWEVLIGSKEVPEVQPHTDAAEAARITWRMAKDLKRIVLTCNVKVVREKLADYRSGEHQFWARYGERHPHDLGVITLRLEALDRMLGEVVVK